MNKKLICVKSCEGFKAGEEFDKSEYYCLYNEILDVIVLLTIKSVNIPSNLLDNFKVVDKEGADGQETGE